MAVVTLPYIEKHVDMLLAMVDEATNEFVHGVIDATAQQMFKNKELANAVLAAHDSGSLRGFGVFGEMANGELAHALLALPVYGSRGHSYDLTATVAIIAAAVAGRHSIKLAWSGTVDLEHIEIALYEFDENADASRFILTWSAKGVPQRQSTGDDSFIDYGGPEITVHISQ